MAASALFGGMGIFVKALSGRIPVAQLALFRSALGLVVLTAIIYARGLPLRTNRWKVLSLRGAFGTLAMLCYFIAIEHIPLAEAVLLNYSSPIFTALFAVVFLKERPSATYLVILCCALLGVAMVANPTLGALQRFQIIALLAGVFSGAAYTTLKYVTEHSSPLVIVWYFSAVTTLTSLPFAAVAWRAPGMQDLLLLTAVASCGTVGQLLLSIGFRGEAVSKTSLTTVFVLVIASVGGWGIFNERPSAISLLGMLVITVAVFLLTYARVEQRASHGAPGSTTRCSTTRCSTTRCPTKLS